MAVRRVRAGGVDSKTGRAGRSGRGYRRNHWSRPGGRATVSGPGDGRRRALSPSVSLPVSRSLPPLVSSGMGRGRDSLSSPLRVWSPGLFLPSLSLLPLWSPSSRSLPAGVKKPPGGGPGGGGGGLGPGSGVNRRGHETGGGRGLGRRRGRRA